MRPRPATKPSSIENTSAIAEIFRVIHRPIAKGPATQPRLRASGSFWNTRSPSPTSRSSKPVSLCVRPPLSRSEEHTSELQSLMRSSYPVSFLNKKTRLQHHPRLRHTLPDQQ